MKEQNQTIRLDGETVWYQFNKNSFGSRHVLRTVSDIEKQGNSVLGKIKWNGRTVTVSKLFPDTNIGIWEAISAI